MTTPDSRDKLDSTLTSNYYSYSRNERRENSFWCVLTSEDGALFIVAQGR